MSNQFDLALGFYACMGYIKSNTDGESNWKFPFQNSTLQKKMIFYLDDW